MECKTKERNELVNLMKISILCFRIGSQQYLPLSTSLCQVHERIAPSPIEMFRSSCLLPNKRFIFHIVYSVMANLRFESIKILPKVTAKRKMLVPWIVTESMSPKLEASVDTEGQAFRTPVHTPNARLALDSTDIKEQYYKVNPQATPLPACASRTLTTLDSQHYAEVASVCGAKGVNKEVFTKAQKCLSVEKLVQANSTLASVDLDSSSNHTQTSKQVLVGSLNDVEPGASVSGFESCGTKPEEGEHVEDQETQSHDVHDNGDERSESIMTSTIRRARAATIAADGNYESLSRATPRKRTLTLGRIFTRLRKKDRRPHSDIRRNSKEHHDVEAFGDRLGSPVSYDHSSRRGSFFTRFGRSSSRSKSVTGHVTSKSFHVDDMVQTLYNKFQNDTEFHMMIMNFRCRAKLQKPKRGHVQDMQRDMKLSCRNTTTLFCDFNPQLKRLKSKKQQREVVNKVLGRESHSKDMINEVVLVDAFRPAICP